MDRSSEKLLRLLDEAKEQSVSLLGLVSLFLLSPRAEEEPALLLLLASERGGSPEASALWEPNSAASKPGKFTLLELSVNGCVAGGAFAEEAAELDTSLPLVGRRMRRDDREADSWPLPPWASLVTKDGPPVDFAGPA